MKSIQSIIRENPNGWFEQLLLQGHIPDLHSGDFVAKGMKVLAQISEAFIAVASDLEAPAPDPDYAAEVTATLVSALEVGASQRTIDQELMTLDFWKASSITRLFRVWAFAANQAELAFMALQSAMTQGVFDPAQALRASVPLRSGLGSIAPDAAVEAAVDAGELVTRTLQHRFPGEPPGELDFRSPYHDGDFAKLHLFAQTFGVYRNLWAGIKFTGWRAEIDDRGVIWYPKDEASYLRREIGVMRERSSLYHFYWGSSGVAPFNLERLSEARRRLQSEARLPSPGQIWPIDVPDDALRALYSLDSFEEAAVAYVESRHFGPLIDAVDGTGAPTWRERIRCHAALRALTEAAEVVAEAKVPKASGDGEDRLVVVDRATLVSRLADLSGLSLKQVETATSDLTFDAHRKRLEAWDMPLISLDQTRLLLIPFLVQNVHVGRMTEHLAAERSLDSFTVRGTAFEKHVAARFGVLGIQHAQGVKFQGRDGLVQCDVLLWWQGYLLILELKCMKGITTPSDEFRAGKDVADAVNQLRLRKRAVMESWSRLREAAPTLQLPAEVVGEDRVLTIALLNLFHFTGASDGGVVVTDTSCLFRYFQESTIDARMAGPDGVQHIRTIEKVREGEPSPQDLMRYLADPPQVRLFREGMETQLHLIPTDRTSQRHYRALSIFTGNPNFSVREGAPAGGS